MSAHPLVRQLWFAEHEDGPMNSVAQHLARLMMGSVYAVLGWDALRSPGGRVAQAGPTLASIRRVAPLPDDDELVVRANAAVQVAGGVLLAAGVTPRLSALALVGSLVPTTVAGHGFWAVEDPATRKLQRTQFAKNIAMIGGLLFVAAGTGSTRRRRSPRLTTRGCRTGR